mgnify:CR=1 FL=1
MSPHLGRLRTPFFLFVFYFFWLAARSSSGVQQPDTSDKLSDTSDKLDGRLACRLSRAFSREIELDMDEDLWDDTYIDLQTIGGNENVIDNKKLSAQSHLGT